jgi:hypothetical protein
LILKPSGKLLCSLTRMLRQIVSARVQSNWRGMGYTRNSWSNFNTHLVVCNLNILDADYIQLFETKGMLRISNMSDQIEYFLFIYFIGDLFIKFLLYKLILQLYTALLYFFISSVKLCYLWKI